MNNKDIATNEGNYQSFDAFIMRHRDQIERFFVRRLIGDEVVCRELISEAYLDLLKHFANMRPNSSLKQERAWVKWRCRNVWSHHWRKVANAPQLVPFDHELATTDEDSELFQESINRLATLLSKKEKIYFLLMADGYSPNDIATTLDVKPRTAIIMRHRILSHLRSLVKDGTLRLENATVIIDKLKVTSDNIN